MTWQDITLDQQKLAQRIKSYSDWTSEKSYIELAAAGFRYTGTADRVKCDYCNKKVVQWTVNDDALEVHSRYGPDCPYLKHIGYTRDLNLPRVSKFSKFVDRLESVRTVQGEYRQNLPPFESIAEAGFFYLGTLDRMSCYHCGLILRDWERDTDPVATHKRFRPGCYFIICWSTQTSGRNINSLLHPYTDNQSSPLPNLAQQSPTAKIGGILINLRETRAPRDQKSPGTAASTLDSSKADSGSTSGKGKKSRLPHHQITSTCKGQFNSSFVQTHSLDIDRDVSDGPDNVDSAPPIQLNSKIASPKAKNSRHKTRKNRQSLNSETGKNEIKTENTKTDQTETGDGTTNQKLKASQATGTSNSQTSSEKQFKNWRKKKKEGTQKTIPIASTVSNKEGNNEPLNLGKGTFGSNCSLPRHRKPTFTLSSNSLIPEGASATPNFHSGKPLSHSLDQQWHIPSTENSSPEGQTYPSHQDNIPEIHSPEVESQHSSPQADLHQLQNLPVNSTHFPELAVTTAAESHLTQSLPPMFNPEGFSELPMIQAVLQMGEVSYDSVVNTICTRYNTHGDTFPDAQSLLSSILDSGVD